KSVTQGVGTIGKLKKAVKKMKKTKRVFSKNLDGRKRRVEFFKFLSCFMLTRGQTVSATIYTKVSAINYNWICNATTANTRLSPSTLLRTPMTVSSLLTVQNCTISAHHSKTWAKNGLPFREWILKWVRCFTYWEDNKPSKIRR